MHTKFLAATLLLPLALFVAGCATPADPAAMVPQNANVRKTHPQSVSVAVSGGRSTNPMWTSQVSDESFKTALESSLTKYRSFSRVLGGAGGEYRLDVALLKLKQPLAGFNMTVTAEIAWTLTAVRSGQVVWRETTNTPYTATMGDAFAGVKRLGLANEGAIRESIKRGLERISQLSI
jgi:hypothetical protein